MRKKETDLKIIQERYNKRLERQKEYNKKRYEQINIIIPAGCKEVILQAVKDKGYKTPTEYIKALLSRDGVLFPDTTTPAE